MPTEQTKPAKPAKPDDTKPAGQTKPTKQAGPSMVTQAENAARKPAAPPACGKSGECIVAGSQPDGRSGGARPTKPSR